MERCGLEVLDVENLRRHYALTLDAWAERFDARWDAIHALDPARFDERFRRTWRSYLWSCAEMFRSRNGQTHLFQGARLQGQHLRQLSDEPGFLILGCRTKAPFALSMSKGNGRLYGCRSDHPFMVRQACPERRRRAHHERTSLAHRSPKH
jgi:hypothetical protein